MIKLIASDMDGTMLWGPDKIIRESTMELIRKILDQGRVFVAASGRQYGNLQRLFAPVKDQIEYICENGSLVIYRNEILKSFAYERELGCELMRAIMEVEECEVLLSGVHTCYVQPKKQSYVEHMVHFVKNDVTVVEDICAVEEPFLKVSAYREGGIGPVAHHWDAQFGKRINLAIGGGCWLDTSPLGADKGVGLALLGEKLGIHRDEMLAIGDNYNDLPMFHAVGRPIVMDTAEEPVKQQAREVTADVDDVLRAVLAGKYD